MMINMNSTDTLERPMTSEKPPINPALMRAANAYGSVMEQTTLSTEVVWAKLLRGILTNMMRSQVAYESNRIDEMFNINSKSMDVLTIMMQSLEVEESKRKDMDVLGAVYFLSRTYRKTFLALSSILNHEDVPAAYEKLQNDFRPLVEHMEKMAMPNKSPAKVESSQGDTDVTITSMLN